jgi:lipopolysaccharide biosynthesis glycosyltransferase
MLKIPVVFATDEGYAMPTAVTITSLLLNASEDVFYDVFVLTASDVSEGSKEKISQCGKLLRNCSVTITDLSQEEQRLITLNAERFSNNTLAAYFRFYIPKYLPQYKKAIYLDSDVLVRKSLKQLYQTDMGNNLIGGRSAIYSGFNSRNRFQNKLCLDMCINSGVLLMNLHLFRQEGIEKELEKNIHAFDGLLADQSVFNLVCRNRIAFLPYTYNVDAPRVLNETRLNQNYSLKELREAKSDPAILHYISVAKPWIYYDLYLAMEWFRYYLASPYKDTVLDRVSFKETKNQKSKNALKKFCCGKKDIVIYGMGLYGEMAVKICEDEGISVSAFVLSDGIKKPTSPYTRTDGTPIPVYYISEQPFDPAETGLIAALNTKHVNQVLPCIRQFKFVYIFQG